MVSPQEAKSASEDGSIGACASHSARTRSGQRRSPMAGTPTASSTFRRTYRRYSVARSSEEHSTSPNGTRDSIAMPRRIWSSRPSCGAGLRISLRGGTPRCGPIPPARSSRPARRASRPSRISRRRYPSSSAARRTSPSPTSPISRTPAIFSATESGRNLRIGVREHAMDAIANGIPYLGGFIPYAATFLTFSDYIRGSVRLAALSGLGVIYVWTHDSVGLGEDGPTHPPVEHSRRSGQMPELWLVRPGDANEAVSATLPGTAALARAGVARGGYVLVRASTEASGGSPELILIATGSGSAPGSPSRQGRPSAGTAGSATPARSWPWTASARQRRPRRGGAARLRRRAGRRAPVCGSSGKASRAAFRDRPSEAPRTCVAKITGRFAGVQPTWRCSVARVLSPRAGPNRGVASGERCG